MRTKAGRNETSALKWKDVTTTIPVSLLTKYPLGLTNLLILRGGIDLNLALSPTY